MKSTSFEACVRPIGEILPEMSTSSSVEIGDQTLPSANFDKIFHGFRKSSALQIDHDNLKLGNVHDENGLYGMEKGFQKVNYIKCIIVYNVYFAIFTEIFLNIYIIFFLYFIHKKYYLSKIG